MYGLRREGLFGPTVWKSARRANQRRKLGCWWIRGSRPERWWFVGGGWEKVWEAGGGEWDKRMWHVVGRCGEGMGGGEWLCIISYL